MVHTKAPVGEGDDDLVRRANLQLMAMGRQEHQAQHLHLSSLQACIFSIASFIPPSIAFVLYTFLLNVRSLHTCSIDELLQFHSQFGRHRWGDLRLL